MLGDGRIQADVSVSVSLYRLSYQCDQYRHNHNQPFLRNYSHALNKLHERRDWDLPGSTTQVNTTMPAVVSSAALVGELVTPSDIIN